MSQKHLYRSLTDRKIAGVAGGLAEYLNVDSTLIRLIWLVFVFVGGGGILAYIIAWIAIPEEQPATIENEPKSDEPSIIDITPPVSETKERQKKYSIIGLLLILVGFFFLLKEFLPWHLSHYLWPFLLIALGILLLIPYRRRSS